MKKLLLISLVLSSLTSFAHSVRPHNAGACAVVYQGEHYTGATLVIPNHTDIQRLSAYPLYTYGYSSVENWNNRISSMWVQPGCTLVGYQYDNFGIDYYTGRHIGAVEAYRGYYFHSGSYPVLGYMNDLISSLTCHCQ